MSEQIKHECGIAFIRLRKPLSYYQKKYGSYNYGLEKMYLLMEKQHNRGQDGAGVLSIKNNIPPGNNYINRVRSNAETPIKDVFDQIYRQQTQILNGKKVNPDYAYKNLPFAGDIYMGHLRYGTFGKNDIKLLHPVMRLNNWKSRSLMLAGNFNLTNVGELFQNLIDYGQHPKDYNDTVTMWEMIGLDLDEANQTLFRDMKNDGISNRKISDLMPRKLNIANVLQKAAENWDGGYVIEGIVGHGDSFITRDPWGIRPAFYYEDDEIVVGASERPVIQTVMNVKANDVHELKPGTAMIVKADGSLENHMIRIPQEKRSCSFERIYFSRGSDKDIYEERKKLGVGLVDQVLEAIDYDFDNTVFSYIPNTAETAFYGLLKGMENMLINEKIMALRNHDSPMTEDDMATLLAKRPRTEKIAIKDVKLRTFIAQDEGRKNMVEHVYDITYGTVNRQKDTLVIIDDSIVRGTTLKQSILRILDRLEAKRIIIVSSAPQIRYPDCYGIDMTRLNDFVAFQAAIALLKDNNNEKLIDEVYKDCKAQENLPKEEMVNHVRRIYKAFTPEQISAKIAELLTPPEVQSKVDIIYQRIETLHAACPEHTGDWYFTGNYPTPGGVQVVNRAFINYKEGKNERSY
ncbi:MAG: amidophosphoribosyltransferase [Candidatus Delongbacteria bacterium]|jgi:amidophosphoribosyltransferase|nr:amidophosphoribosyltransferase [Candidatus Delongbacteria bacterium]